MANSSNENINSNEYQYHFVQELKRINDTLDKHSDTLLTILTKLENIKHIEEDLEELKDYNKSLNNIYSLNELSNLKKDIEGLKNFKYMIVGMATLASVLIQWIFKLLFKLF